MQLSYGATIKRPSYYDMRSGIGYDNRYTYESGNPFLVSEISRNINYMVSYKWLMAEGIYTHVSDPIVMLTQSYKDNPNIALIQNVNWKPYNRIGASLSASPNLEYGIPLCVSISSSNGLTWKLMEGTVLTIQRLRCVLIIL